MKKLVDVFMFLGMIFTLFQGGMYILGLYGYVPAAPAGTHFIQIQTITRTLTAFLVFFIYYALTVIFKIDRPTKKEAKIILSISDKILRILHIGRMACKDLLQSDEIEKIIKKRTDNIRKYVNDRAAIVTGDIDKMIDADLIDALYADESEEGEVEQELSQEEKNERKAARARIVADRAYNDLINVTELEAFIKKEIIQAQEDVIKALTSKMFDDGKLELVLKCQKDISMSLLKLLNMRRLKIFRKIFIMYNPNMKELFSLDYYHKLMRDNFGVPNLSDLASATQTADFEVKASVNTGFSRDTYQRRPDGITLAASTVLITPSDIGDMVKNTIQDVLWDEFHSTVLESAVENIAMLIPGLSLFALGYKLFRYGRSAYRVYQASQQTQQTEAQPRMSEAEIRAEVIRKLKEKVNKIADAAEKDLKHSCDDMLQKINTKLNDIRIQEVKIKNRAFKFYKASTIFNFFFYDKHEESHPDGFNIVR